MVPAMTERPASGWRERIHHLVRREALGREPTRCVGEGTGGDTDDDGDQHQRSKYGARGRPVRLGHSNLPVTVDGLSTKLTIPVNDDQSAVDPCSILLVGDWNSLSHPTGRMTTLGSSEGADCPRQETECARRGWLS